MLTDERHEARGDDHPHALERRRRLAEQDDLAASFHGQRQDHTPSDGQLIDEARGHVAGCSEADDGVVGCLLRKSERAVAEDEADVLEAGQVASAGLDELGDTLDADDAAREVGAERGGVAVASANLQHPFGALELEGLEHARGAPGLRRELPLGDGDGAVAPGEVHGLRGNEPRAIDEPRGGEDPRIADAFSGHGVGERVDVAIEVPSPRARQPCSRGLFERRARQARPHHATLTAMAPPRLSRRRMLALGAAVPFALTARPASHLALAAWRDGEGLLAPAAGFVDDASGLSATRADVVMLDPVAAEEQLATLFARARAEHRPVAIAGARHTMGGHTSAPGAYVVEMARCKEMALSTDGETLRVGAGALWSDVIPYLHEGGRSVAVMQSNSSFSVGGSLGANAHGWQQSRPPIASTVESFRIARADGTVVHASRTENAELFRLALGGYGLFGVLLDVDLRVVGEEMYTRTQHEIAADDYPAAFAEHVERSPLVGMAYGRIAVGPEHFLERAIVTAYHRDAVSSPALGAPSPLQRPAVSRLARAVFRGSAGSDYGKDLRWDLERRFGGEAGERTSRNQILSEPVTLFQNRDPSRTDVLHEYFVPKEAFAPFLARLRAILPGHRQDLLNITVRNVMTDADAFLTYADGPLFSLVMLFNHARTVEADAALARLARELCDAALSLGGRHYLPYRLHATPAQVAAAYPMSARFFEAKRAYDPELLFRNHFFDRYGS